MREVEDLNPVIAVSFFMHMKEELIGCAKNIVGLNDVVASWFPVRFTYESKC